MLQTKKKVIVLAIVLFLILILVLVFSSKKGQNNLNLNKSINKVEFVIGRTDHVRGDSQAPVTIIEFSDFECPYCAAFYKNMRKLWKKYPHKIRWVYKQFPLDSIHPQARAAAEASECAAEQGKFWEFADRLEEERENLGQPLYQSIASSLFLDIERFNSCVNNRVYKDKVNGDMQLGIESSVKGTPTSFFNGYMVPGVIPFSQLEKIVNSVK